MTSKTQVLIPKPYDLKPTKKIIAVTDTETDKFFHGLVVKPFCLGFYTGNAYYSFWGEDCVKQFFEFLAAETVNGVEYIIYAHNGGKFDFLFFLDYLDENQNPLIIGARLVKVTFQGQEFRDSMSIIPQALSSYQKDEIDYNKFDVDKREQHRDEILAYLKSDCIYTYDLIAGFHNMFGDKVTVASAALPMLNSFYGFKKIKGMALDDRLRNFYFGGRNQCFETGKLNGDWKVYDRNSMYPAVMRDELHPVSDTFDLGVQLNERTDFALIVAKNDNCLPIRAPNGGLDFTQSYGEFYATIHEINAGLETGTLRIDKIKHTYEFHQKANFADFVNHFYDLRLAAKIAGDKILDILYKLILNSSYGKFAINPRKFKQWTFTISDVPQPLASDAEPEGWSMESQDGPLIIWSRPAPQRHGFQNVATAASITGAARANLHRNLALAKRPIYCDTDSIICEGFNGELNETELGGWKLEATGTLAAIAGKKLYGIFNESDLIKKAHKGVNVMNRNFAQDILDICDGQTLRFDNPVPNFKMDGSAKFVSRNIKMTGTR